MEDALNLKDIKVFVIDYSGEPWRPEGLITLSQADRNRPPLPFQGSSTGRAFVSKTKRCGFEAYPWSQFSSVAQLVEPKSRRFEYCSGN